MGGGRDRIAFTLVLRAEHGEKTLAERRVEYAIPGPSGGEVSPEALAALAERLVSETEPAPTPELAPEEQPGSPSPAAPVRPSRLIAAASDVDASGAAELIAELAAEGKRVDEGQFTLSRAEALAKLEQFQLGDPHRYVVFLLQGAVRRGATTIRFDIDSDDTRLRFDGPPYGPRELADLLDAFVNDDADRAARAFSFGLSAALALEPRFIRLRSGDGAKAATYEIRSRTESDGPTTAPADLVGTEIHVKSRRRLGRVLGNLRGTLPEERYLMDDGAFCPATLELDGRAIARPLDALGEDPAAVVVQGRATRGYAGYLGRASERSRVGFLVDGVIAATEPIDIEPPGFEAVVESPYLRLDLSQEKVIAGAARDDALRAAWRAREPAQRAALVERAGPKSALSEALLWPVLAPTQNEWRLQGSRSGGLDLYPADPDGTRFVHIRVHEHGVDAMRIPAAGSARVPVRVAWVGPDEVVGVAGGQELALRGGKWKKSGPARSRRYKDLWPRGELIVGVGERGLVTLYYDGAWKLMNSGVGIDLNAVFVLHPTWAMAVGSVGQVIVWDGLQWNAFDTGIGRDLVAVWAHAPDCVYVAWDTGIAHYDGVVWRPSHEVEPDHLGRRSLSAIWGAGPDDIVAVGVEGDAAGGYIVHRQNERWFKAEGLPDVGARTSVWGRSADEIYTSGWDGSLMHYNGKGWREVGVIEDLVRRRTLAELAARPAVWYRDPGASLDSMPLRHPGVDFSYCLCDISEAERAWLDTQLKAPTTIVR